MQRSNCIDGFLLNNDETCPKKTFQVGPSWYFEDWQAVLVIIATHRDVLCAWAHWRALSGHPADCHKMIQESIKQFFVHNRYTQLDGQGVPS